MALPAKGEQDQAQQGGGQEGRTRYHCCGMASCRPRGERTLYVGLLPAVHYSSRKYDVAMAVWA